MEKIREIQNPAHTILLLDALDEDAEAWSDFNKRLLNILRTTQHFKKTLITCRTQFFPMEYEEDGVVPGQIIFGGFHCSKLFLSPFTDEQVDQYLEKRFSSNDIRLSAKSIVNNMKSLRFRPMLLAHIDFLLDHPFRHKCVYSIYEALVEEWLNREIRKPGSSIDDKEPLRRASNIIACRLYMTKEREISTKELKDLYLEQEVFSLLRKMTIEGRSLLHRTSKGGYKFSHYSILEYFVATSLTTKQSSISNTDMVVDFLGDLIRFGDFKKVEELDLHKVDLSEANLNSVVFTNTQLEKASFRNSSLANSNLSGVIASGSSFEKALFNDSRFFDSGFRKTNFIGASISSCEFEDVDFLDVEFMNAGFDEAEFRTCKMHRAKFIDATFQNTRLHCCECQDADLMRSQFTDCKFINVDMSRGIIRKVSWCNVRFRGGSLCKSDVSDALWTDCMFENAEFVDICGDNLRLNECKFWQCKLDGGRLAGLHARGGRFRDTSLKQTDLSKVEISESQFIRCNLRAANLSNSTFEDCIFDDVDFSEANFEGVRFQGGDLRNCLFEDARFNKHTVWPEKLDVTKLGMLGPKSVIHEKE